MDMIVKTNVLYSRHSLPEGHGPRSEVGGTVAVEPACTEAGERVCTVVAGRTAALHSGRRKAGVTEKRQWNQHHYLRLIDT